MVKRRVGEIPEHTINDESGKPIRVRESKGRYVLTESINRLEASKALGEKPSAPISYKYRNFKVVVRREALGTAGSIGRTHLSGRSDMNYYKLTY